VGLCCNCLSIMCYTVCLSCVCLFLIFSYLSQNNANIKISLKTICLTFLFEVILERYKMDVVQMIMQVNVTWMLMNVYITVNNMS